MNSVKDVYFINTFKIANKILGNDILILSNYALIIAKPETIVFRKLDTLLKLKSINNRVNVDDHYINQLLSKAQNNRLISNVLLWLLLKNRLIEWNIKSLSVLTLYAIYLINHN